MDFDADPDEEDADDGEDDEEEIPPPDPRRVAARCGVFAALAYRALLEKASPEDDRSGALRDLRTWVAATGEVDAELEPSERALLDAPFGAPSPRDLCDASWLVEPAAVLAWSLRRADLPAYDQSVVGEEVAQSISFLESPWPVATEAILRDEDELVAGWSSALTVHWRLREYGVRPVPRDFRRFIRECAWAPMTTAGLVFRDDDLVLRGRTLAEAGDDFDECRSIASERQRAFEWLLGGNAVLWSEVTADT